MLKKYAWVLVQEKMQIKSNSDTPVAEFYGVETPNDGIDYEEVICLVKKNTPDRILVPDTIIGTYRERVLSVPIQKEPDRAPLLTDEEIRSYDKDRKALFQKLTGFLFTIAERVILEDKSGMIKSRVDFLLSADIEEIVAKFGGGKK